VQNCIFYIIFTGSTANSVTIKLQRFHGFTPAAIKNTAISIFPDDVQFILNMLFAVFKKCRDLEMGSKVTEGH